MSDPLRAFRALLERSKGAHLDYLNSRVPHRYTAVYRLENGMMVNIDLFDKLGAAHQVLLPAVPLQDSLCPFAVEDQLRLDHHPMSYLGVPLMDGHGELFGTLCHIDECTHDLPEEEVEFLHRAARVLPTYLLAAP